jgi:hypothetical protein
MPRRLFKNRTPAKASPAKSLKLERPQSLMSQYPQLYDWIGGRERFQAFFAASNPARVRQAGETSLNSWHQLG